MRNSSSDTGSKEDRALLLMLGQVIETGANDCSAVLIFLILSLKKYPKKLARSLGLTRLGKIMVEDLWRIILKVFHRALALSLFSAITME